MPTRPRSNSPRGETDRRLASTSSIEVDLHRGDVGKVISGRYRVSSLLGEGGMGVVYRALDIQIDRDVAIKLMRRECLSDRKFITRFRRELEVTSQFRHPSTIRVYEHGETDDGRPYMVMELLTGESLSERLERGRLPELQALQYAKQIAESLSEAHENEVYHRDLKPDNLFIETVGVTTVVKVLDFGIAGGADALRLTQAGEVFGTPQYMSPEQCNGQPLDHRTDIYSLGVILYEMIEGRPPFAAETPMATMLKHVRAKAPPMRHAHPATSKLLMKALRKDRAKRIQSAARFAELIDQAIDAVRAAEDGHPPPNNDLLHHTPRTLGTLPGAPNVGTGPTIPAQLTPSPTATLATVDAEQKNRGRIIALTAIAVATAVTIALLASRSEEPPASETVADADETPQLALPLSRPLITANIPEAEVWLDGEMKCITPCQLEIPVGDETTHEIVLKKDGYIDVTRNWRPLTVTDELPPMPDMKPLGGTIEVGKKKGSRSKR